MPDDDLKDTPPLPALGGSYRWDAAANAWVLVERTEQPGPLSVPPTDEEE